MLYHISSIGIVNKKIGILLQFLGEKWCANNIRKNILILKRLKTNSSNVNSGKDANHTYIR